MTDPDILRVFALLDSLHESQEVGRPDDIAVIRGCFADLIAERDSLREVLQRIDAHGYTTTADYDMVRSALEIPSKP